VEANGRDWPDLACSRSFSGSNFACVYRYLLVVRQVQVIALLVLLHCSRAEDFAESYFVAANRKIAEACVDSSNGFYHAVERAFWRITVGLCWFQFACVVSSITHASVALEHEGKIPSRINVSPLKDLPSCGIALRLGSGFIS
jgi:hypothetical protein